MGFILYPPYFMEPWYFGDHQSTMLVTILFTRHIASVLIIMFMIRLLVYKSEKAKLGNEHAFEKLDNIEVSKIDSLCFAIRHIFYGPNWKINYVLLLCRTNYWTMKLLQSFQLSQTVMM